jgi:hypothetical protein
MLRDCVVVSPRPALVSDSDFSIDSSVTLPIVVDSMETAAVINERGAKNLAPAVVSVPVSSSQSPPQATVDFNATSDHHASSGSQSPSQVTADFNATSDHHVSSSSQSPLVPQLYLSQRSTTQLRMQIALSSVSERTRRRIRLQPRLAMVVLMIYSPSLQVQLHCMSVIL